VLDGCGGRYPKYAPVKPPIQCLMKAEDDS